MKIEIKKLFNLTGNIFKFNMRNRRFWVFIWVLIGFATAIIMLGSFLSKMLATFDSTIVLTLMPYFNMFSAVCLGLVFVMFAATPLFRDKDLALYDLEKRYGYKPWEIVLSRMIWIFTMCLTTWLFILIVSLIGGTFGAVGSKVIYIKMFVMPSVWNLYLLFLIPLLTMFLALVFGILFGKMILYFAVIIVAFSPVVSNFVSTFTTTTKMYVELPEEPYKYKEQLISNLLVEKYFKDTLEEVKDDAVFQKMLTEYVELSKNENGENVADKGNEFRRGIPFFKDEHVGKFETIKGFYDLVVGYLPKHTLIKSSSNDYNPQMFNSYLSKVKNDEYKNLVKVLKNSFNEWNLLNALDNNYGSGWDNSENYKDLKADAELYDNSLEIAAFNVSFFTVIHEYAYKNNLYDNKYTAKKVLEDELVREANKFNGFTFLLNPLNTWTMMFGGPIQERANILLKARDYAGRSPYRTFNYDFKMVDGQPVVYEGISEELVIAFNFILMIALYGLGYILWKRQILK